MKPLVLVGEMNPYGADPAFALYHLPRHASGNRLREHLGLSDVDYEALDKVNLCTGRWSMLLARTAAEKLKQEYNVVVCLGVKVRTAFGAPAAFTSDTWGAGAGGERVLVTLPHPSGLNRVWNAPGSRQRARELLQRVVPGVPWGSS